jgi:mannose-6-phosphate isomerase-like protein (cupin superfamily)
MISKFLCGTAFILFASSTVGQASEIRRVVTGLSADNKAIVLFDSRDKLIVGRSGNASLNLWITDASPPGFSFKDDAAKKPSGLSPPDNGTAFRVVEFPPTTAADEAKMEPQLMMKLVGDHAPARGLPVTHPFMHRTRTVDYAIIMSGEIDMKLDDSIVHLKAGDVVVQQATNHAWINHSGQPVRVMFVLMDSKQP